MNKYLHACDLALNPQTMTELDPNGEKFSPRQREIIHDAFSRLKAKIQQGRVSESVLSSIFPGLE
jgi:hypothetical protein